MSPTLARVQNVSQQIRRMKQRKRIAGQLIEGLEQAVAYQRGALKGAKVTRIRREKRTRQPRPRFAICINNRGYPAALEPRKLYQVLPDAEARTLGQLRIVDESGEDYLYPATLFITGIRLPWKQVREKPSRLFSRDAVLRSLRKAAGA